MGDIERRFKYHAPDAERRVRHDDWRSYFLNAAHRIDRELPDGREKSLALTKLEECSFWVHADIARRQYDGEEN